jgi:hypothetical protein
MDSNRKRTFYIKSNEGRLTGLVISCVGTFF